jgi:hypothetical protein
MIKEIKTKYEVPQVEIINIQVEQGFAASGSTDSFSEKEEDTW